MPSYTIQTWLDTSVSPYKIRVNTEEISVPFGSCTLTWIATPSSSSWNFVGITFSGVDSGTSLNIESLQDHTLIVSDADSEQTSADTIHYTLYVFDSGTTYDSDPIIVNQPKGG